MILPLGTCLLTLGTGDITPQTAFSRIYTVFLSGLGLFLLSLIGTCAFLLFVVILYLLDVISIRENLMNTRVRKATLQPTFQGAMDISSQRVLEKMYPLLPVMTCPLEQVDKACYDAFRGSTTAKVFLKSLETGKKNSVQTVAYSQWDRVAETDRSGFETFLQREEVAALRFRIHKLEKVKSE